MLLISSLLVELFVLGAQASASFSTSYLPQFVPCEPESELVQPLALGAPSAEFCRQWNPDFRANGRKCCPSIPVVRHRGRRKFRSCASVRAQNYCEQVSFDQKAYQNLATSGKLGDLLSYLTQEMGKGEDQAFCTVNNGFLVKGRPIVSTPDNRVIIQSPERCLNFGTDAMAAMVEWLGREVSRAYSHEDYAGARLVVGDVSGPKGGCLVGKSGRRRHASHTTGQDADVGFLYVKKGITTLARFVREFNPAQNWWLFKKIFKNPYACIKVIFLDRIHIHALARAAQKDPEWPSYARFIRHMPGHKNHFHIRIGNGPGIPGCSVSAKPEDEEEDDEDLDIASSVDSQILDELRSSQAARIQE